MFALNDFIIQNLKKCVETKVFSKEQAGIFALNYLNKGQISEIEFQSLVEEFSAIEEDINEEAEILTEE